VYGSGAPDISVPFRSMLGRFATLYFFVVYALPADALRRGIDAAKSLIAQDRLRHLPVKTFPLRDIAAAHECVEQGANAKVLVRI
jgi:NADPH2:quinone reductase